MSNAQIKQLTKERDAAMARADVAEKRLADLRTWAEDEDAWDGYHVGDVIEEILRCTEPPEKPKRGRKTAPEKG